jgi:hypothetical protein
LDLRKNETNFKRSAKDLSLLIYYLKGELNYTKEKYNKEHKQLTELKSYNKNIKVIIFHELNIKLIIIKLTTLNIDHV